MNRDKKVSVIIPVYNGESTIGRCLQSVDSQTESDMEIVIVNDGSTDVTEQVVQDTVKTFRHNTVYHYHDNRGEYASRVAGLEVASGKYILFVDADDEIIPDHVKSLVAIQEKYDTDLIIFGFDYRKNNKKYLPSDYGFVSGKIHDMLDLLPGILFSPFTNSAWNKLYKTEMLRRSLEYYYKLEAEAQKRVNVLGRDYFLNNHYFPLARHVLFTDYPVYIYNYNKNSLMETFDIGLYLSHLFFLKEGKKILAKYCKKDFREILGRRILSRKFVICVIDSFTYLRYRGKSESFRSRYSSINRICMEMDGFDFPEIQLTDLKYYRRILFILYKNKMVFILALLSFIKGNFFNK